ncbi:hypothetical protein EG329_004709 [Mollisiaceae sp. DMI_Dod_QoI]|nr:hypothetical protein EG329_004709 [Helotiales sp. DMI_Dod_QoI]
MRASWTQDESEWTLTHAFFANMGGFVIDFAAAAVRSQNVGSLELYENRESPPSETHREPSIGSSLNGQQCATTLQNGQVEKAIVETAPDARPITGNEILQHGEEGSLSLSRAGSQLPAISEGSPGHTNLQLKANDLDGQKRNNDLIRTLGHIDLQHIISQRRSFSFGPFWVHPWRLRLRGNYFNSADVEKIPQSPNGVILGQAMRLSAIEHIESHASLAIKFTKFDQDCANIVRLQSPVWAVNASQLLLAREYGIIDVLPQVSEEELKDQSKGDLLVKSLAMAQSLYLALQLIVRHINHQPSSQLEVVVVAFAVCSFLTYLLLFSKPQGVDTPRYIKAKFYPTGEQMLTLGRSASRRPVRVPALEIPSYAIPNVSIHDGGKRGFSYGGGMVLASIIFGSLHCIAWNFSFPRDVERLLWRLASIFTIAFPPFYVLFSVGFALLTGRSTAKGDGSKPQREAGFVFNTVRGFIILAISFPLFIGYLLARIYVIVEIFRSLFFLPPEAFQTTAWLSAFPFIG